LELLGSPRLQGGETLHALERRTAGVLAYLALEGPHPKYRLAGLMWPESVETTARNNMRQLLRRLRLATGVELVGGGDVLTLSDAVLSDAAELEAHAAAGRHTQALELSGALLGTLEFDDCPEFQSWLENARERLDKARRRAAGAEAEACERRGDLSGAVFFAERLLTLDPYSEEAWRRLMRLHYVAGDRMAALNVFERCRRLLREELDTTPLPETLALARTIERGQPTARASSAPRPQLPLSVLRPPVLVGREREWARMEAAWQAGQIIFISGEPGVGKTRLAHDFANSKGACVFLEGRPGDVEVPFSTHLRFSRQLLARRPDLKLEPWVRREMARIFPELVGPGGEPPPMAGEAGRVRFLQAQSEFMRQYCAGLEALVTDDMQFLDTATFEVAVFSLSRFYPLGPERDFPRFIDTFRRGELKPEVLANMQGLVAAGMAILIELEPLDTQAVGELLGSLELPGAQQLVKHLTQYTGGNPLFITETLKHLLETGGLERGWPEPLAPAGRVRQLIQHRLERLSLQALQVARVAALARTAFGLELAGEVLEMNPLSLAEPVAELEAAQILRGERFTHDLLFEAVRAAIPRSLETLLHRRLAVALEGRRAAPGLIAQHWMEGQEPRRAVPFLVASADAEMAALRHVEAAVLYHRAAALLEEAGEADEAALVRSRARSIPSA
jgi:DNA-binding SARP family transcriptional activator